MALNRASFLPSFLPSFCLTFFLSFLFLCVYALRFINAEPASSIISNNTCRTVLVKCQLNRKRHVVRQRRCIIADVASLETETLRICTPRNSHCWQTEMSLNSFSSTVEKSRGTVRRYRWRGYSHVHLRAVRPRDGLRPRGPGGTVRRRQVGLGGE